MEAQYTLPDGAYCGACVHCAGRLPYEFVMENGYVVFVTTDTALQCPHCGNATHPESELTIFVGRDC